MKRLRQDLGRRKTRAEKRREELQSRRFDWTSALDSLREKRAPYDACARELVARLFDEHVPADGALVEVGAGTGQLRRWLTETHAARFLHTEPDALAVAAFTRDFSNARVAQAGIEQLPCGDGQVAGLFGLCILDLLGDLPRALREIRRVLAPGGRLIHLLDMDPVHARHFTELSQREELALPNVFGEPLELPWPHDLLVTHKTPMAALLDALRRLKHPLPQVFGRYFAVAMADRFDPQRACEEYQVVSQDSRMRELLRQLLESAHTVGFRLRLEPPRGTLVSSGKHLAERMERAAAEAGLEVVMNEVKTAWSHRPADDPAIRLRSFALGQGRLSPDADDPGICPIASPAPDGVERVELGMLVFVARAPS